MSEQPEWGIKLSAYFCIPQRVIMSIMTFMAIVNAYTMRICISIAITELVVKKNITEKPVTGVTICIQEEDIMKNGSSGYVPPKDAVFEWDQELQGFILSSFFYGYILTHIPAGILADYIGGKHILNLGMLMSAISTVLTPVCLGFGGAYSAITLRVIMGLGQGSVFPAISTLIAQWIPLTERGKLGSIVLGGGQIGSIFGNMVSGFILHYTSWPWVFYFWGGIALVWCFLFTILCYNDPNSHPFIKPREREFLKNELGALGNRKDMTVQLWVMFFTSSPMWALLCAQIGHDWGLFIIVTDLPKYMADVMRFKVKDNGIYSSLPFLAMWLVSIVSAFLADWLIAANIMSITNVRKVMTSIAAIGPGLFMVLASYGGCDRTLVVILFIICMATMGPYYCGMKLTPIDMSPNYAGILMAISNGIGSITGIIAPTLVGYMTPNTSLEEWRVVFWISFAILFITTIIYIIWASAEVQPFNDPPKKESSES